MKISETIKSNFFTGVSIAVISAAIIILIQFSWMANTKLVKLELENDLVFKEFMKIHGEFTKIHEEFAKIHEEFKGVNSKLDSLDREVKKNTEDINQINKTLLDMGESVNNNFKMLEEVQSQLENYEELEKRVENNEIGIERAEKSTEFLRGQVDTMISKKQE